MSKKFRRTFFVSFLCFIIIYGMIGYYNVKSKSSGAALDDSATSSDEILFLVLGIDGNDMSKSNDVRTDTMMLTKVNFKSGEVSVLSIPRDTRVILRGRDSSSKINAAHKFGGPELSVEAVRDLLGVDLKYYVKIDYKFVREIVDLIGGVEVDVPFDMQYDDISDDPPLHIDVKEGRQVLDGDKSIQFLRYRSGYKEGDIGRVKAQQQFIKAFMVQALKPQNILKAPVAAWKYYKYSETNIPMKLITKGVINSRKIDTENLKVTTLPGEGRYIDGVSYFTHYEEQTRSLVNEMFENYILTY